MKYYRCPRCKDFSYLRHHDFSYCSNCNFSQGVDEDELNLTKPSDSTKEINNFFKKVDRKLRQHFEKKKPVDQERNRKELREVNINNLLDPTKD